MKFIELTSKDPDVKVCVNLDHIMRFGPTGDNKGTMLHLSDGSNMFALIEYEALKKRIG